jgi:hypothetical protein
MSKEFEQSLRAIADRAKLAKGKAIPAEHADRLREAEKIRTIIADEWKARIHPLICQAVKTANRLLATGLLPPGPDPKPKECHLSHRDETYTPVIRVGDEHPIPPLPLVLITPDPSVSVARKVAGTSRAALPPQNAPCIEVCLDADGRVAVAARHCEVGPRGPFSAQQFDEKQIENLIVDFCGAVAPRLTDRTGECRHGLRAA